MSDTPQVATPSILIVNGSHVATDAELAGYLPAFQSYVDRYLGPAWGVRAALGFVPFAQHRTADPAAWWIVINNHSDIQGDLGWHDAHPSGLPFARVFAGDDKEYGASLSVTITHELAEMLGDPAANMTVQVGPRAYMRELCDAVEADELAILINGIACSDFVLPSYFKPGSPGPWDQQHRLGGAVPHLTPGGYVGFEQGGSWHQLTARRADGSLSHRSQRRGRNERRAAGA